MRRMTITGGACALMLLLGACERKDAPDKPLRPDERPPVGAQGSSPSASPTAAPPPPSG